MIRSTYLLLLGCLFVTTCFGQYANDPFSTDPKRPDKAIIKNRIAAESIYRYKFGNSKIKDSTLIAAKKYFYDINGMLIKEDLNDPLSTSLSQLASRKFMYLSNGFLAKITEVYHNNRAFKNKIDSVMYEFKYDKMGNQIYLVYYNQDTTSRTIWHKIYNSRDQLIEVEIKMNDNDYYKDRVLTYNERGDISAVRHFNGRGDVLYSYIISYDYEQNKQFIYVEKDGKAVDLYQEVTYSNKKPVKFSAFKLDATNMPETYYIYGFNMPNFITKVYYDDSDLISLITGYVDVDLKFFNKYFYAK